MKKAPAILFAIVRIILGGVIGAGIGLLLFKTILPFWTITSIGHVPEDVNKILFVDYQTLTNDPSRNVIYLQSSSKSVYYGNQDNWQILPPLPDGLFIDNVNIYQENDDRYIIADSNHETDYRLVNGQWVNFSGKKGSIYGIESIDCVKEWSLPIFQAVDSAGVSFEHALAAESICYVLKKGGRMQVWSKWTSVFHLFIIQIIGMLAGMVIGGYSLAILNKYKPKPKSQPIDHLTNY